jgi:hypothetical protein
MKIAKPHKWLLILFLAIAAGVLFFFFRMSRDDIGALKDFMASYERFDRAISDLSMTGTDDSVNKAGNAAADLDAKASLRLSSLIKNDAGLMDQAREVADLARREIDSLRVARVEAQNKNTDLDRLAEESRVLTGQRKAAYARFRELGGSR